MTALAHVELDYPQGGETFSPGEVVKVKWHVIIEHDPIDWDLYFSSDGGETWELLSSMPVMQLEYDWTVPEEYTEAGRIKIVQDNDTQDDYDDISDDFTVEAATTPVELEDNLNFKLLSNFPNPFHSNTTIQFELPEKSHVILTLCDLQGRKIKTLLDEETPAGRHPFVFQRNGLTEGYYIYRIKIGDFTQAGKMLIMK